MDFVSIISIEITVIKKKENINGKINTNWKRIYIFM